MISPESELFTRIAIAVRLAYPEAYVSGEYVPQPPRFPAVSIIEQNNSVFLPGRDSGAIENFAEVMYQVDVYSNKVQGKKAECKAIAALIDEQFVKYGFTRTFLNPVQNINEPSIYRMTGRYQAVVGRDNFVYRR